MPSPGDSLRATWTSAFYQKLVNFMAAGNITASGRAAVARGKNGTQISIPDPRNPVSTLQGILAGGTAPDVTDGATVIDLYAFNAYSIQAAAFILAAGTTTLTVAINGVPVSWLDSLPITTTGSVIAIPSPPPDDTHIVSPGDQLTIVLASSAGASGLAFSLNCPF
jgi:hypothetical protein